MRTCSAKGGCGISRPPGPSTVEWSAETAPKKMPIMMPMAPPAARLVIDLKKHDSWASHRWFAHTKPPSPVRSSSRRKKGSETPPGSPTHAA